MIVEQAGDMRIENVEQAGDMRKPIDFLISLSYHHHIRFSYFFHVNGDMMVV